MLAGEMFFVSKQRCALMKNHNVWTAKEDDRAGEVEGAGADLNKFYRFQTQTDEFKV